MTEVLEGNNFTWIVQAEKSYRDLKTKLTRAPILGLSCFDKVFEVDCDASKVGIVVVLI